MSVTFDRKNICINGQPTLVIAGEVHYFRLRPGEWRPRLEALRDAGCNTVATYIPWLCHDITATDSTSVQYDLTGSSADWRDVLGFLDLAKELGLYVIARPGPFVMAELKNEGIPNRIYDLPGARPVTWGGEAITTHALDYSSPAFRVACKEWLDAIAPALAVRQMGAGGSIIAVQLDNEIGMLSWVSNQPDLTEPVAVEFANWLLTTYSAAEIEARYTDWDGARPARSVDLSTQESKAEARHSLAPWLQSTGSATITHDLALFSRVRYRDYAGFLRDELRRHGVIVPLLINIHGTSAGRGRTYPIGISQLVGTWMGRRDILCGSDMYLGELTIGNLPDVVLGNRFAESLQPAEQPLSALEFECGNSDYGEDKTNQTSPNATALKTRLAIALGNRMLNYYLLAGGTNPKIDICAKDGNGRIAFTGERHGFAAPIDPEGMLTVNYDAIRDTLRAPFAVTDVLLTAQLATSGLALGFIPDLYLTEYCAPNDARGAEIRADLERHRGMGPREILARALTLIDPSYRVINLSSLLELGLGDRAGSLGDVSLLAVASAHYMPADVQQRLANYVRGGGKLLLAGAIPTHDMRGEPCTIFADALGVEARRDFADYVDGRPYYLSVRLDADAGLPPLAEARVTAAQTIYHPSGTVLMREARTGEPVAMQVSAGRGEALLWCADYPCHLGLHTELLARLGHKPGLTIAAAESCRDITGVIVLQQLGVAPATGLLHIFNIATHDVQFRLALNGDPLMHDNTISMRAQTSLLLPLNLPMFDGAARVLWSTAEFLQRDDDLIEFGPSRLPGPPERVCVEWAGHARVLDCPAGPLTMRQARAWFYGAEA